MSTQSEFGDIRGIRPRRRRDFNPSVPTVAEAYAGSAWRQGRGARAGRRGGAVRPVTSAPTRSTTRAGRWPPMRRRASAWRRIVARVLPSCPIRGVASTSSGTTSAGPAPGAASMMSARTLRRLAAAGLAIRIASIFGRRLRGIVRALPELAPWAEPLIICSEVGVRKPHPIFYQAVCESLGLPPHHVLFARR